MSKLDELFIKYGSDKSSQHHNYSPIYSNLLEPLIIHPIVLLELGIGGYHHQDIGGGDLKAFSEYLPYALIIGVDKYRKEFLDRKDKIVTYVADQNDSVFFEELRDRVGDFDIVIDDASHINSLTIKSFEIIFPMVKSEGLYIIEDVHSSYWNEIAIDGTDFGGGNHPRTTVNYFKSLIDTLNYEHCAGRGIEHPVEFIEMIDNIQFFKELIVVVRK